MAGLRREVPGFPFASKAPGQRIARSENCRQNKSRDRDQGARFMPINNLLRSTLIVLVCLCLFDAGVGLCVQQPRARDLHPTAPLRSEVSASEPDALRISVKKGELLRLVISQRSGNLIVALLDPAGNQIEEADSATNPTEPIEISFVAANSGSYRFVVSAAAGTTPRVQYEARVAEIRLATRDDCKVLADKSVQRGKKLEAQSKPESLRRASASYEKALALFRILDDKVAQAETSEYIGVVHYRLEEWQKALEAFQRELQLWREAGNHVTETAATINNIGVIYAALGLADKSIESYEAALALRREAGDRKGVANTLDNLGSSYLNTGELDKALDYFNQALALYKELNIRGGIANALNNIGGVHLSWDNYRKAAEYFEQALEMRRALGHRREEAIALNNLARVYDSLGDAQKALDYNQQALELRRALGQPSQEGASLNNIGLVYEWLGERKKALDYYQQALALFRKSNDRGDEASALNNIAAYYFALGDMRTALEYHTQALEMRRALRQPIQEATELDNIGLIHNKLGDPKKALEYHQQALETRRALGHRLGEAVSLQNIGAAHLALHETKIALDYFNQALQLYQKLGSQTREVVALRGIATIEAGTGDLTSARNHLEDALTIIESLRGSVASQELRASYVGDQHELYEFYIDLVMRLHRTDQTKAHDVEALRASERAHARSLLELLAEARIDVEQGISSELKQRERASHSRISFIQRELLAAYSQPHADQKRIALLEQDLNAADAEREQLNMQIRQKHPRYAELQYPEPLGLRAIQSLLDDRTVLLEYALGKDASFLFAITKKELAVASLPSESSIVERVTALRRIISSPPQRSTFGKLIEYSRELYRDLIQPAGKLLAGKNKLIIVPSGALHYLPFEVLLSSGEERLLTQSGPGTWPYLIRDYAISYVPSAGVLASLRSRGADKPPTSKKFLGFADPTYESDQADAKASRPSAVRGAFGDEQPWKLGRLEESRREVEQIASLYPREQVSLVLGENATEENVKAMHLGDYRFVHFATHGLLNEERPPYSGLILTIPPAPADKPGDAASRPSEATPQPVSRRTSEDGLLQVYEVFNLKLNAQLAVLSACQTGLGKQVRGEGLIGLTHAFLYAGAQSVLVSLWKVQDRSTADLMVRFYQQINDSETTSEALRRSKLKLIDGARYAHPYYWAPFVLIGEPK